MSDRLPLSILIPIRNEADNLPACIASAQCAGEIVVVDSGSTDGSAELARRLGARVVDFRWDGRWPKKKNWALSTIDWRHEWVFILDADERITPELAAELRAVLAAPDGDGYYVNRRFWFLDGWLRHCGYYPSWNLRLFRHRLGRYEQLPGVEATGSGDNEVHEHVVLSGNIGYLRAEMEHYAFPTIAVWVEKHNRYSNWEAQVLRSADAHQASTATALEPGLARKRRLKRLSAHLPFRPTLRFLYHYVWRAGFLDGYRGFVFCRLMGIYEFLSHAKARELARAPQPANPERKRA
ncbi:MAG TPA: glycosyltransferase family 2 protein [Opitutaceae bacterium]